MYKVDGNLPENQGFLAWLKLMLTGGRYMSDTDRIINALRPLEKEFSTDLLINNVGYPKIIIKIYSVTSIVHLDYRDYCVCVMTKCNDEEKDIRDFVSNGKEIYRLLVEKTKPVNELDIDKMMQVYIEMIRMSAEEMKK